MTARLPTTIVCKYCLEEPEACDCESCGNDSARLIECYCSTRPGSPPSDVSKRVRSRITAPTAPHRRGLTTAARAAGTSRMATCPAAPT